MRINVLQHTPNEGPGTIADWAHDRGHEVFIYHPYQFGVLPSAAQTGMLVILGGPMSPNDNDDWIIQERQLIKQLLAAHRPLFGACFGAQQIAKTAGAVIKAAPHKEVGWAPVYRQNTAIPELPVRLTALHWHQEMFELPKGATLLFSSDLVRNQGFLLGDNVIGLQFHLEPKNDNVREIAINDCQYPLKANDLHQTGEEIIAHGVPAENKRAVYRMLDFISNSQD
ncbi:type 1 glutamine amidotransferase [uncultured Limosilactobacillus sp.]|uniref:type 1 glutamine amidotransferase n=1 Tax=uncultured Limosilactobacillus sp. TaxID=2837629 RepID=UPI0025EF0858|nr:type 1 glutamine amidotransferase [uncultured Limosilactobacillus sp.]